jgi:ketosteroid isomerase-like protein
MRNSDPVESDERRSGGRVGPKADPNALEPAGADAASRAFARAMVSRDALAAASYFSHAARMLTPDGTEVRGRLQIVEVLRQVTDASAELEISVGHSVVGEGVAFCTQFWRRRAPGQKAGGFDSQTTARLVLAVREEGWRIMIAAPWE